MRLIVFLFTVCLSLSCTGNSNNASVPNTNTVRNTNSTQTSGPLPVYTYEVVNTYPHDPKAFTEGLFYKDGFLYESTGETGKSSLRKVELETGKVVQKFDLPPESFGEGISMWNNMIYQLTWREGICRVFDAKDFTLIRELEYQGQGWGMTTDGTNLYMTDSTHVIRVLNPETFRSTRMIVVMREDGKPLMQINELEWIKGELWANVWHSEDPAILGKPNYIARIDPNSGKLLGWIDLAGISPDDVSRDSENTLNGIAYDAAGDRIFVTGKNWKKLFEIKVKEKPAA
jgi:glutamine cyclotransferase